MLLIGAGAILLFVSLFLEWYQPGIDAWEIFEVWDLVLAVLAIVALVAVASRLGFGPPRPASWLIGPALAALVIVLYLLINPPPLTPDIDGDPSTGLWLALASAVLMAAGALLSVARISVAINPGDAFGGGARRHAGRGDRYDRAGAGPSPATPSSPVRRPRPRPRSRPGPGRRPPAPRPLAAGTPPHRAARRRICTPARRHDRRLRVRPAVVPRRAARPRRRPASSTCASAAACAARATRGPTRGACRQALAEAQIAYRHHRELAPTTELRQLQYAADDRNRVGKRSRAVLDPEYVERYVREILDRADLDALVAELPADATTALLCVEADPEACHRSLIAERLARALRPARRATCGRPAGGDGADAVSARR